MSVPSEKDADFTDKSARQLLDNSQKTIDNSIWCFAPLENVKNNIASTGYLAGKIEFVKGKIEDTIPQHTPSEISLLRLDTDWYESTYHELTYLFPKLVKGGVLIIDDYGHWKGAREAVDQYISINNVPILLNRIDYTGRIGIKL